MIRAFVLSVVLVACGSSTGQVAPEADATQTDTATVDTSVADSAVVDTGSGETTADATADAAADTSVTVDTAEPCKPFWCGCGTCVAAEIVCTRAPAGCPLGCPSGPCPEMEKPGLCTPDGDRCVRNGISGDIACLSTADCPKGQCCSGTFTPPARGKCAPC